MIRIEPLPIERWPELQKTLEETRSDEQLPKPEASVILGASDGERVVATIGAERVWCVSLLRIETEYRGNGLAKALAVNLGKYNTEGLREMCITTNPHVEKLIFELGFIPIQGQMWRREVGYQQQIR